MVNTSAWSLQAVLAERWRFSLPPGIFIAAVALGSLVPVTADMLDDWNVQAIAAIRAETTAPPLAARNLAMLHIAIHDAVNSLTGTHTAYLTHLPPEGPASAEAAVAGAAHRVLINLFPSHRTAFDAALADSLAQLPDDLSRSRGEALGQSVADLVLDLRADDGASTTVPYIPSTAPGAWRRTPPYFRPPDLPQWGMVAPFALVSGSQFRPVGPPELSSARYAAECNQVKELGGVASVTRTAEQELIAYFWADFTYTVTPPGHWNQIARSAAGSLGLSLAQKARLFALLNLALADAAIATWDAKYAFNFWRPVTAIQLAAMDDNPETAADADWTPLLNTPSFPEYVSGHSTFSAAAATVLTRFLGTDQVSFTVESDSVPGVIRSYSSFAATAEEIGMSRIYGGIHFLSGDLDGLSLGQAIGDYVNDHFLLPLGDPPRLRVARRPEGTIQVTVDGSSESPSILEYSEGFGDWVPLMTGALPFAFDEPAVGSGRFYRARRLRRRASRRSSGSSS
jgi:membrane-associated phospholipid phosphatase